MMQRIIEQIELLFFIISWVVVMTFVKFVADPKSRGWRSFLYAVTISVPFSVLIGGVALENGFTEMNSIAIAVVFSFLSDRVIIWLTNVDIYNALNDVLERIKDKFL